MSHPLGDVAGDEGVRPAARTVETRDRRLDGKYLARGPAGGQWVGAGRDGALASELALLLGHLTDAPHDVGAHTLGEEARDRRAARLAHQCSEHPLGGGVDQRHAAVAVEGYDGVHR